MSYIGRQISNLSDRVKLDSITASATATYNLLLNSVAYVPSSAESLTVSLNGVIQAPQDSYTVSGSTITFASTLSASDSIDFILAERSITLQTPSSGSVNTEQLASGSVTAPKLSSTAVDNTNTNSTLITAQTEKTSLVDADKFLISDSAASGALKYVQKSNLPSSPVSFLKVHSATNTNQQSSSSSSFANVISLTWTPQSANSKHIFLVSVGGVRKQSNNTSVHIRHAAAVSGGSTYTYNAILENNYTNDTSTASSQVGYTHFFNQTHNGNQITLDVQFATQQNLGTIYVKVNGDQAEIVVLEYISSDQ